MSIPSQTVIERANAANAKMAGPGTPLIFNAWYCAGFRQEFARELVKRQFLGRNLVLYRTEAGEPVALDDRCAHRSFPLSAGHLEGDTVVCAYHGFCYDKQGDCVRVPSQSAAPRNVGVRSYPLYEHGRLVWIWMGDPSLAEGTRPPIQSWMEDEGWDHSTGYLHLPANYVGLHENLLDLTHIEFLHARTLGRNSPGFAAAPYETTIEAGRFMLKRHVEPTGLPPVFAETTGLGDTRTAARVSQTEFVSPGFELISATYFDGSLPQAERREFEVRTAHLITPESQTTTHYFIDHAWNWGVGDATVQERMHAGLFDAFYEDVEGLSRVAANVRAWADDPQVYEVSVATDSAAVAMRRHLKALADLESQKKVVAIQPMNRQSA